MIANKDKILVLDDDAALIYKGIVSKFVYFGQLYYLFSGDTKINIPASPTTNHRWILDDDSICRDACVIKLVENDNAETYMAIRCKSGETVSTPNWAVRLPDFVCHFIRLETIDKGERNKEFLQIIDDTLDFDKYSIKFDKITAKKLHLTVNSHLE